jgi:hypothetical protein
METVCGILRPLYVIAMLDILEASVKRLLIALLLLVAFVPSVSFLTDQTILLPVLVLSDIYVMQQGHAIRNDA